MSCKAKFSQRYDIYLVDLKCNITYQNIRGKTKVRPIFIPWNAYSKKVTQQLTWMGFLQNLKVNFNQEGLPITYHNFRHQSLVKPKSKYSNWKGSQSIRYKANFSLKGTMPLIDVKFHITYQNKQNIIKVRPFLRT